MILGLDIGTTSVSGVLFDPVRRTAVQSASHRHAADVPGLPPGCHEQCPQKILAVALKVVRPCWRPRGYNTFVGDCMRFP